MGFVGALLLLCLSFGAVVTANDPMPPKITETFSTWFFEVDNQNTIISSGYIARDMDGNREFQTGAVGKLVYAKLDLLNQNSTYSTHWDENGNKTCYIYNNDSPRLMPMWDWIQNTSYKASIFNEDIWEYYDDTGNVDAFVSVPSDNPIIPLEMEERIALPHYNRGYVFSGFDPMYVPVDADFDIPTDCQPIGKGDPPPHHFLPHSLHRFRGNEKIHHHKKMNIK